MQTTTEWQPIATAPRDGTDFLAFCIIKLSKHCQQVVGRISNGIFLSRPGNWRCQPTHWTPLPQPPEDESP